MARTQIVLTRVRCLISGTLLSALLLLGCEHGGELPVGAACGADDECESGLCIAGVAGDDPACTLSCAADADCPEGWSCSGVTARGIVVCRRGGATPFGQ